MAPLGDRLIFRGQFGRNNTLDFSDGEEEPLGFPNRAAVINTSPPREGARLALGLRTPESNAIFGARRAKGDARTKTIERLCACYSMDGVDVRRSRLKWGQLFGRIGDTSRIHRRFRHPPSPCGGEAPHGAPPEGAPWEGVGIGDVSRVCHLHGVSSSPRAPLYSSRLRAPDCISQHVVCASVSCGCPSCSSSFMHGRPDTN